MGSNNEYYGWRWNTTSTIVSFVYRYRRYEEPSSSQMTVPENRPLSAAVGRILAFRKFARNLYSLPASGSSIANVNVPLSKWL